jgi:hypothetical protein
MPEQQEQLKPTILKQSNLNNFLNIDEMPQETCISTVHGIFSDIHSTPISGKRPKKIISDLTIENAFGFDECDTSELSPVKNEFTSLINKEKNIKENKNEKDKLKVLSKNLKNTIKKPILKYVLKEKPKQKTLEPFIKKNANIVEEKNHETNERVVNSNEHESTNKSVIQSISFSDTFDILCEKQEIKLPEEIPLFIDLQPVHFDKVI